MGNERPDWRKKTQHRAIPMAHSQFNMHTIFRSRAIDMRSHQQCSTSSSKCSTAAAARHVCKGIRGRCMQNILPGASRRELLLQGSLLPLTLLPGGLVSMLQGESTAQTGNCPTCVGAVDGTLGTCSASKSCVSSFDDRPGYFLEPWEYEERTQSKAQEALVQAVSRQDGVREVVQQEGYVYAQFSNLLGGTDDVEFLFLEGDKLVQLRAAARSSPMATRIEDVTGAGRGRLTTRFEDIRLALGWEVVPVLRNRVSSALGIGETPFDSYGPAPPTGVPLQQLLELMDPDA